MPALVTEFVDITALIAGPAADKFGFGRLMGVFTHSISTPRQAGPYFSLAEVTAAGFTAAAAPAINAWATAVFAQENNVDQVLIGRRIDPSGVVAEQVWQFDDGTTTFVDMTTEFNDATDADWDVFPASAAVDDYTAIGFTETFGRLALDNANGTAGIGGVVTWEYWNGSAWSALAGVVDGTSGFTTAAADGQIVTWTVPNDWVAMSLNGSASLYYVRAVVTTGYGTDPVYDQGTVGGDQTWTATMDAIRDADPNSWYGHNIESRLQADIEAVATWTEAQDPPFRKIFIAQSDDPNVINGVPGNVALSLQASAFNRTALSWYHDDLVYADGAWEGKCLGFNLDVPGGKGSWNYKALAVIQASSITGAQATEIYDANANWYGALKGLSFMSKGTMASGRRIADQTTIDWLVTRLEEAILTAFVSNPLGFAYTPAGIAGLRAAAQAVFDNAVLFGHAPPDDPPELILPDVADVSVADKQSGDLTGQVNFTLAGEIGKFILTINLSF